MASIPSNGYREVMAGTNVYTGSNFYGSDCPKTPIVPTDPDDLTNKLYVDTMVGGGSVVSVTGGNNITVSPTTVAPVVSLQSPLTATLALGTQDITAVNGVQSLTINALGIDKQYTAVGANTAVAQLLTSGGGDPILGLGSTDVVTGQGHLLEVSADLVGTAKIEHLTVGGGTARDLAISTQGVLGLTAGNKIDLTPSAGQDANVIVSGAGGLHVQQATAGGSANPSVRITNSNATTGGVNVDFYKNKTGATNDIVSALNFYGKDNTGTKRQFGGIESVITSAGGGGGVDGALDFYSCVNGGKSLVFRLNGADNENNSFRPLDMNGNNIVTNSGDMTITTSASAGTGTMTLTSKGAMSQTATTGGINLTANAGGTIQNNTTGSFTTTANTSISLISNQGIMNMSNELHYGKVTTPYADQVYQSTYQPILTAPSNNFPVSEIQREGQQVIFINSAGDGANELTAVSTPNFTITAILYKTSISQTIVGGYNHIQGRCEIRCGAGINDVVTAIGSGFFNYIAFPTNSSYFINVLYNSPLYPDTVAVGGFFAATPSDTYDGTNFYPSAVLNFLCVDAVTSVIVPLTMSDANGFYGVDGVVTTINAQSNTYYTPATQPIFILGGKFQNIVGSSSQPASRTAVFCQNGTIPPADRWNSFIDADADVNKIWVLDDRVVFGGLFNIIGGNTCPYLAFNDNTLTFPNTSLINGFIPPSSVNAGFELSSPASCYFGCNVDNSTSPPTYPVYTFDLTNMATTPTLFITPATELPAVATGFSSETGATLDYIVGHNSGADNFCYKVQTPDFIDLNGAVRLQNCFIDTTTGILPAFFHQASLASAVPTNYYLYFASSAPVSITTTLALPFVSALAPANNWKTITLASRNNFATGTVVQFGDTDQRIVILASFGATFSN
jgi:hypothetical protein